MVLRMRIQRRRTKGWKLPVNTIYVGRPSKWGNPFRVGEAHGINGGGGLHAVEPRIVRDAVMAVELYERWFADWLPDETFDELHGKDLACWCPLDQPCHADVLLKRVSEIAEEREG